MRDFRFVLAHRGGHLKKEQHRQMIRWSCDCVMHALPLLDEQFAFEKLDDRLKHALFVAREWEKGNVKTGEAMKASVAAHAFAREAKNPILIALARAIGHAVATAHMSDHSLGGALYSLKALKLAGQPIADERKWRTKQLPQEIKDLILTTMEKKEEHFKLA